MDLDLDRVDRQKKKRYFFEPVKYRKAATLISIIKDHVRSNPFSIADLLKVHSRLDRYNFINLTVNHSLNC